MARQTHLPDVAKFLKDASVARFPEDGHVPGFTKDANAARSPKDVKVARGSQRKIPVKDSPRFKMRTCQRFLKMQRQHLESRTGIRPGLSLFKIEGSKNPWILNETRWGKQRFP